MRTFLVNVGYALNVALLGLVSYFLPSEGSRAPALVLSILIASLVVVLGWLALHDASKLKFGRLCERASFYLPAVAAFVFIWLGGSASAGEGLSPRVLVNIVLVLISAQTFGQLWLLAREQAAKPAA